MSVVTALLLAVSLGNLVLSYAMKAGGEGLRNKHLIVEGEYWPPFLMYKYHDDDPFTAVDRIYSGVMWDLLLFMQKARNFTFTMVNNADWVWGECFSINNCTGMIGMVNRKEVDLAIGKGQRNDISVYLCMGRLYSSKFQDHLTSSIALQNLLTLQQQ